MNRVLIGSPIRQEPDILREFLISLTELNDTRLTVDFAFVDDNESMESQQILHAFRPRGQVTMLNRQSEGQSYVKTEVTHVWNESLIWKVARYKNQIIDFARRQQYDGLFFVDSDLILHPNTLTHLIQTGVDIVSEVFWTRWNPDVAELPQVWVRDQYTLHEQQREERLKPEEIERRQRAFLARLRQPGLYEVGGLGACTLVSRRALQMGVHFGEIPNLGLWGEDRHFCIRAVALGLKLYASTYYPALHLYRRSELPKVAPFRAEIARHREKIAALQTCKEAVRSWGTTHYETITGDEGAHYFTPAYRKAMDESRSERVAAARSAKSLSRLHMLWAEPREIDAATIQVNGAVLQEGRENGKSYADYLSMQSTLHLENDGWRIADMQFQPLQGANPSIPFVRKSRNNRVVLSMLVKNEADRYLAQVLRHAASYVDEALILDDGSTDHTVALCQEILQPIPYSIISLKNSIFHNEHELRRKQWELTVALQPDWILNLDADEIFEDKMRTDIRMLINQDMADAIAFRLYDFWDAHHYRDDAYWQAHKSYRHFLVRYLPGMSDQWQETAQHCGRFPLSVGGLRTATSEVRLKHLGWANPEDRRRKYERYMQLDPEGKHGILQQYQSIMNPAPHLVRWQE